MFVCIFYHNILITTEFCTYQHSNVALLCANCIVIGSVFFKILRWQFLWKFEFIPNIVNGTGARFIIQFPSMISIDRLVQERRNSIANSLELHLSCTNSSIWSHDDTFPDCWTHWGLMMTYGIMELLSTSVQVIVGHLNAKPLPKPVLFYCQFEYYEQITENFESKHNRKFSLIHLKMLSAKCQPFCTALNVLSELSTNT